MKHFATSIMIGMMFVTGAVWGISNTHSRAQEPFLQDLLSMLPPQAYQGETCSVEVKSEKKLGTRTYSVGVTFTGGEQSESFQMDDSALGPQVVQYNHDFKKENFLKIVTETATGAAVEPQKLTVIRSRGQVAAVAIKEKVCFLN